MALVARADEYPTKEVAPWIAVDPPVVRRLWQGPRFYAAIDSVFGTPFDGVRAGGGWGYGIGFQLAFSYADWPVMLGADFDATFYGIRRGTARGEYDGQSYTQSIRRRERVGLFDLFLRVMPTTWKVRPYAEGVVGFKLIAGQYRVSLPDGEDDEDDEDDQTTYSLGGGVGFDFTLADEGGSRFYVTVGYRYLRGGNVSFLKNVGNEGGSSGTVKSEFATTTHQFTLGFALDVDIWSMTALE